MVAILMSVLVTLSVFAINLVYMEITRTELRSHVMLLPKPQSSGGSTQSQSSARSFAKTIAQKNPVGGGQLSLSDAQSNSAMPHAAAQEPTPLPQIKLRSIVPVSPAVATWA